MMEICGILLAVAAVVSGMVLSIATDRREKERAEGDEHGDTKED